MTLRYGEAREDGSRQRRAQREWVFDRDDQQQLLERQSQGLVKRVGEVLPTIQARRFWRPGSPGSGSKHRRPPYRLVCYLTPSQALVTQLSYLLRGGWMSGRAG
jgi:hypothetical protein